MIKVGMIGLGGMGRPVAECIARAGFPLVVADLRPEPVSDLVAAGAGAAATPAEVAARSDIVIASLPSNEASEEVALGPDGVLAGGERRRCLRRYQHHLARADPAGCRTCGCLRRRCARCSGERRRAATPGWRSHGDGWRRGGDILPCRAGAQGLRQHRVPRGRHRSGGDGQARQQPDHGPATRRLRSKACCSA